CAMKRVRKFEEKRLEKIKNAIIRTSECGNFSFAYSHYYLYNEMIKMPPPSIDLANYASPRGFAIDSATPPRCWQRIQFEAISEARKTRERQLIRFDWSYPGADENYDHNLMTMRINVKLKKIKKGRRPEKWALDKLETNEEALRKSIEERVKCELGATV